MLLCFVVASLGQSCTDNMHDMHEDFDLIVDGEIHVETEDTVTINDGYYNNTVDRNCTNSHGLTSDPVGDNVQVRLVNSESYPVYVFGCTCKDDTPTGDHIAYCGSTISKTGILSVLSRISA